VTVGPWDVAALAVKAILYGATLGAAGGLFFLAYGASLLQPIDRVSIRRRLAILAVLSIAASLARILLTAASMSGDASGMLDAGLLALVWHGGEGRSVLIRAAGFLLAAPALAADRRPGVGAIAGAAGAATSFAWVGHAHGDDLRWTAVIVGIHLVAAAFWVGALWPLRFLARGDEAARVAAAAVRFGNAALAAVSVLIAAGVAVLGTLLGNASALWRSDYGRTACIKLTLVACLLGFAALNKLRLTPRVAAGAAGHRAAAARALRRSIAAEMVLAGAVFLATAALTTLTGPAPAAEHGRIRCMPWC